MVGTAVLAVQAVGKDQPLHRLGVKMPVEKIAERAREKAYERRDLLAAHAAEATADAQHFEQASCAAPVRIRRRLHEERLQVGGEFPKMRIDAEKLLAVFRSLFRKLLLHPFTIRPPGYDAAVRHRCLHARITGDHPEAVSAQLQVAYDFRAEH